MKKVFAWLSIVLCSPLGGASHLLGSGFSSPNIPIEDPVYRDIDQLVALGLVKEVIYGQRPWSRREIARILEEARQRKRGPDQLPCPPCDKLIEKLTRAFHQELVEIKAIEGEKKEIEIHHLDEVRVNETFLNSPFRAVPVTNGLGNTDAEINPFLANQEGRHYVDGNTLALETIHWARLSDYFSLYLQPRFELLTPQTGQTDLNPIVQQLYGKFGYRNLELEAGRDSLIWGQGEFGGVLASNNARAIDMVKLTTSGPFYHPWIFKYLGPSKYTFFVANLGPDYVFKDAFIYGLAASIRPISFFELGFEHQVTTGGEGAPSIGFVDLMTEFFLVRRSGAHANSGPNLADHRFGLNMRLSLPPLRGSTLYAEGILEDYGRASFFPQFTQQMALQVGVLIPLLTRDGENSLRIEYEHIPAAYGRHSSWTSGLTLNQTSRGSELGPDGQGLLLDWFHTLSPDRIIRSSFRYENRDSDRYASTTSSSGGPDRVFSETDNTTEHRFRILTGVRWAQSPHLGIQTQFGYERVQSFNFTRGDGLNNFMLNLNASFTL